MYAASLVGKNSLNFDSGNIASTFLTFCGFVPARGWIASTDSLSSVHEAVSLWFLTSSVIGSEVSLPQIVPVQDEPPIVTPKSQ